MRSYPKLFIQAADLGANFTSNPISIDQYYGFAIAAVLTGTPSGTVKLQASCEPPQDAAGQIVVPTTWIDIGGTNQVIGGAPTNILYNIDAAYYSWIRIVYTRTGSTGAMDARVITKGV